MSVRGRTLLVVEDSADHALLVQLAARRVESDLDTRIACDGQDAVAYMGGTGPYRNRTAHPAPDLVIVDVVMPNLDGSGVLEWMRGRSAPKALPVLVLTSSANPGDEVRAPTAGARAFHTEPSSLDDLGAEVRRIDERWLR